MTPEEREEHIDRIFHEAVQRTGLNRWEYLAEACRDLPEDVRREIETLLEADSRANAPSGGFLGKSPIDMANFLAVGSGETQTGGDTSKSDITASRDATRSLFRSGDVLADRYVLESQLGHGGMGAVYKARDQWLGRDVALKFLLPEITSNDSAHERFTREARSAASLSHANICTIYDVGQAEGRPFLAMEYVEGNTLKQIISLGPLPIAEALGYVIQLTEGLEAAHNAGVVHRDVKPANVIVNLQGTVKIVDFGLAQIAEASQLTQTGMMLGTASYMSPEQLLGEEVDHRSDQWSVGVVTYELLTGKRPFDRERIPAVIHAVLSESPTKLGELIRGIPEKLEQAVNRTLQQNPADRYSDTSELVALLKDSRDELFLSGGSVGVVTSVRPKVIQKHSKIATSARLSTKRDDTSDSSSLERRQVTALFCNLAGMHDLGDPESYLESLPRFHGQCKRIIRDFDAHHVSYPGGGILTYFGFPTAHGDDAQRAVMAGLQMIDAARALNAKGFGASDDALKVSVGIHTGQVVAQSNYDGEKTRTLKFVANLPDVATQLQSRAAHESVVVSESTERLIKDHFVLAAVSGDEPTFEVLGKAETRPHEGAEDRHSLIGRDHELSILLERWQHAKDGRGQVVLISGEPGIGKSCLLQQFTDRVANESQAKLTECRCSALQQHSIYRPVIDWLEKGVRDYSSDSHGYTVQILKQLFLDCGISDDVSAGEMVPLITPFLSCPMDDSISELRLSPDQQKARTQQALLTLLLGKSSRHPLLLTMEDLQWADEATLELLTLIIDQTASSSILLVITLRSEFDPPWPVRSHVTQLSLSRLTQDQASTLVEQSARGSEFPREFVRQLTAKADGVPLFIEELTKMVLETGGVDIENWRRGGDKPNELAIPATLQDLLTARLDRLDTSKEVAQIAAILGREFTYELVQAIAGLDDQSLRAQLDHLVSAELLFQRGFPPHSMYSFKHALIQDAAYQSLLKSDQQRHHRDIANCLETRFPKKAKAQPELLAHHLLHAGEERRAVDYLLLAGDKDRGLHANDAALRSYRRALDILKKHDLTEASARTLMKLGLVYTAAFEPEKAREAYHEAFSLWQPEQSLGNGSTPAEKNGTLRFAIGEPISLDPGKTYDSDSAVLQSQLFEGLVELDADQNVVPAIADRWEVSEDGTVYIFKLRTDFRWSDGQPVSAGDFEYAWKRNLTPTTGSPAAHLLFNIRNARAYHEGRDKAAGQVGVKALGAEVLEVRLETPSTYLPYLLAHPITYPLPSWAIEEHGEDWTLPENIVTNGAYVLEKQHKGRQLLFHSNDLYYGSFPGNVGRIEGLACTSHREALKNYGSGQFDMMDFPAANSDVMSQARAMYEAEITFCPLLGTNYLVFRNDSPPFDDVLVRQAFAHALDQDALIKELRHGQHLAATGGFLPYGMPGYSSDAGLEYDPREANRLLAEAGFPDGQGFPPVTLVHTHGLADSGFIPYLRDVWKESLGIDIAVEHVTWEQFEERLARDPPQLMLACWIADYPDPDNFLRVVFHGTQGLNEPRWRNKRFDALVEKAERVTDPVLRMQLFRDADRILVEEAAIIPLTYAQTTIFAKPRVKHFPRATSYLMRFKDIVVE